MIHSSHQIFQRPAVAGDDALDNGSLQKNGGRRCVQLPPALKPYHGNPTTDRYRLDGAREIVPANQFQNVVGASAAGVREHLAHHVGCYAVDCVGCAESFGATEFVIARRCDDNLGPVSSRDLQGEQCDASGSGQQHGFTRFEMTLLYQREPSRKASYWQCASVLVVKGRRRLREPSLGKADVLGEHTRIVAAEGAV